jgi:KUP system potassium uptake protein
MLTALGIVYGDLGTSPLYTMQTVMDASGGKVDAAAALGILSLIVWALIIVISVKYCVFVMRADNRGEGGILALMALLGLNSLKTRWTLVAAGLFGAALIYGDGIITPAISVLSALEGINVLTDAFKPYVMPAAVVILLLLFAFQRRGTASLGSVFGPIMLLWFVVIGGFGVWNLMQHPGAIAAIDPRHGLRFLAEHGFASLLVLGGVFLALTGGEAMYADMGHMGRDSIRFSWYLVVLPALLLSYAGQTSVLIGGDAGSGNPFFRAVPGWAVVPMVCLATVATIIASQAIITGAFSLTRQAVQLGWFPGVGIRQTSDQEYGQIYVPVVNWLMMACTLALTIGFQSSDRLAGAYGTAVSTTMLLTTLLLYHAMRERWGWPVPLAAAVAGVFGIVDIAFFVANLLKIIDGGWIPLLAGGIIFTLMTTWRRGIDALRDHAWSLSETPDGFMARLTRRELPRVSGTAVFLTRAAQPISALMVQHGEQFGAFPASAVSLTVAFTDEPRVPLDDRVKVEELANGVYHLTVSYGFIEIPDLPAALALAKQKGCAIDLSTAIFFAARDDVVSGSHPGALSRWRRVIFAVLYRNAVHMSDRFNLKGDRFVEVGRRLEI